MITISGVTKKFKKLTAVNNLSFSMTKGEFVAILGPNGAGKTTLVEMIEGIIKPNTGTITIADMNWQNHATELRKFMGMCLQETKYMEKVTVQENIQLFADIYDVPDSEIQQLITQFGLEKTLKQYAEQLSGGQRQKLSLLIALLHKPELIILDEPTTGLDPSFRREIWDLLKTFKKKGLTLILTTHYMEEAEILCDRVYLMDQGHIIKKGSVESLLDCIDTPDSIQFEVQESITDTIQNQLAETLNLKIQTTSSGLECKTPKPRLFIPKLMNALVKNNLTLAKLEYHQPTLEDVFIALTGKGLQDENTI